MLPDLEATVMMSIVNGTEQTTTDLIAMGRAARAASRVLAPLNTDVKNAALLAIADELEAQSAEILAQNALDIAAGREKGLSDALLDRLLLTEQRIARLAADSRAVAALPDPVGADFMSRVLPNGLRLSKRRIPIGVLGVIYEARPNVTIDIAVLSLKTGNAAIMRGGSETLRSNIALTQVIQTALEKSGLPRVCVQYIDDPDRALVRDLLRLDHYVDMIIPRGGHRLHELCRNEATVPVITGGLAFVTCSWTNRPIFLPPSPSSKTPKCSAPAFAMHSIQSSSMPMLPALFCRKWRHVWHSTVSKSVLLEPPTICSATVTMR